MPHFIRRSSTSSAALVAALVLAAPLAGCGPTYVRGNEVAGLDDQAMSTGLDKRDIDQLLHENLKALMASPVARQVASQRAAATDDPAPAPVEG